MTRRRHKPPQTITVRIANEHGEFDELMLRDLTNLEEVKEIIEEALRNANLIPVLTAHEREEEAAL